MNTTQEAPRPADPRPIPAAVDVDIIRNSLQAKLFSRGSEPVRVDRFVILSRAGTGGMGIVYRAYDPELQREVALKLVRPDAVVSNSKTADRGMARLLQEARAAARVTHPNVVTVHQVGMTDDGLFIAMEFINGSTLRRWCRDTTRSWREIVDLFVEAGTGLAEAHRVDVIHRDFKPDNVLVSTDGHAHVVDFGLAIAASQTQTFEPSVDAMVATGHDYNAWTDAAMGTPAYMSPEQHRGLEVSARSDQFSFCVALWECLSGERPFAGDSPTALRATVLEGIPALRADPQGVPRDLLALLKRGLDPDPCRRFASMDELVRLIRRTRAPSRFKPVLVLAALCAAALGGLWVRDALAAKRCAAAAKSVQSVWNDERASALHDGMLASGSPIAKVTFEKVRPWLDDYAHSWAEQREHACLAAEDEDWSPTLRQQAEDCFALRATHLNTLVEGLTVASPKQVVAAVRIAASIPPAKECGNATAMARTVPRPAEHRDLIADAYARASKMNGDGLTGAEAEALLLDANALVDDAITTGYPPLHAEVLVRRAQLQHQLAHFDDARDSLIEAMVVAGSTSGAEIVAAAASSQLASTLVMGFNEYDNALRWTAIAEMWLDRAIASDDDPRRALAHDVRGIAHLRLGHNAAARASLLTALELKSKALGTSHPDYPRTLNNLANIDYDELKLDAARTRYLETLEALTRAYGPEHPTLAAPLANLARIARMTDSLDESSKYGARALALRQTFLRPDHPVLARSHADRGQIALRRREFAAAVTSFEEALRIYKLGGQDSAGHADALSGLGQTLMRLGRNTEALPLSRACVAMHERLTPDGSRGLLQALIELTNILVRAGDSEAADTNAMYATRVAVANGELTMIADARRHAVFTAIELRDFETALERTRDASAAAALADLGIAQLEELEIVRVYVRAALGLSNEPGALQRVLKAAPDTANSRIAGTELTLVAAFEETPNTTAIARALCVDARQRFLRARPLREKALAETEQWLAAHPAPTQAAPGSP